jgi:hypothetical protein
VHTQQIIKYWMLVKHHLSTSADWQDVSLHKRNSKLNADKRKGKKGFLWKNVVCSHTYELTENSLEHLITFTYIISKRITCNSVTHLLLRLTPPSIPTDGVEDGFLRRKALKNRATLPSVLQTQYKSFQIMQSFTMKKLQTVTIKFK